MTLLDKVRYLQELFEKKEELAEATKANNAAIEEVKEAVAQQMIDDDCPRITCGGYNFSLTPKTSYSKKSEAAMAEAGVNFLETLRDEGLGDIIQETVNPRTLQATMAAYVEEHGELSESLAAVITAYEYNDITRRRDTRKKGN